jgi:hypothetical protein
MLCFVVLITITPLLHVFTDDQGFDRRHELPVPHLRREQAGQEPLESAVQTGKSGHYLVKLMITCCSTFLVLVTCLLPFCMLYVWALCVTLYFYLFWCIVLFFLFNVLRGMCFDMYPFILVNILFRRLNWSTDYPRPSRPPKCAKCSSTRSKYAGSQATRPLSAPRAASCRCRCQEAERYTFCFDLQFFNIKFSDNCTLATFHLIV